MAVSTKPTTIPQIAPTETNPLGKMTVHLTTKLTTSNPTTTKNGYFYIKI